MRKERRLVLVLICSLLFFMVHGQKKYTRGKNTDKDACMALVGYLDNTIPLRNISVHLYVGSNPVDSLKLNSAKDFGFILKRNLHYTIQISCKGYYSRILSVNTDLPDDVNTEQLFIFEFELSLVKEMKGVDDFFLDFPIASIFYDQKSKKFSFNQKYTASMEKEMQKAESKFKLRKSTH